MIDDDTEERGEVATTLNYRSARLVRRDRDRDRALATWFTTTPSVIVDAILDHMDGRIMSPDMVRVAGPYILRFHEIWFS